MKRIMTRFLKNILLWLMVTGNVFYTHAQPNIIFDTDMGSDCDDAGALAVLHKLADKGEVKILGVMFSSGKNKYGVGVCDAINTYYGRGNLPLGQYKGNDVGDPNNTYSIDIATNIHKYPHDVIDSAQEIVAAYKKLLQKQPNKSVTILTVGHPNGIFHLIQDKKGIALVKQKVKQWVAMAFTDTIPKRDWNFGKNGAELHIAELLQKWPTPLYVSGQGKMITGNKKLPLVPENNPVKQAYRLWKNTLVSGRPSPDQVAVLFAVRPNYFRIDSIGSIVQDSLIQTCWRKDIDDKKQHRVIPILSNSELEVIIEDLMTEPPSNAALGRTQSTTALPAFVWKLQNPKQVSDYTTTVLGNPIMVSDSMGTSLSFNGVDDGLIVSKIPVEGWNSFSVEVLFKPAGDGYKMPRFIHLEDKEANRITIEVRIHPNGKWYLDTYLKNGSAGESGKGLTLFDSTKLHATDKWCWAALVYDGKKMYSYVNGVKELEGDIHFPVMKSGEASLGVRLNKIHWFKGLINEVRFYPQALDLNSLQRL